MYCRDQGYVQTVLPSRLNHPSFPSRNSPKQLWLQDCEVHLPGHGHVGDIINCSGSRGQRSILLALLAYNKNDTWHTPLLPCESRVISFLSFWNLVFGILSQWECVMLWSWKVITQIVTECLLYREIQIFCDCSRSSSPQDKSKVRIYRPVLCKAAKPASLIADFFWGWQMLLPTTTFPPPLACSEARLWEGHAIGQGRGEIEHPPDSSAGTEGLNRKYLQCLWMWWWIAYTMYIPKSERLGIPSVPREHIFYDRPYTI